MLLRASGCNSCMRFNSVLTHQAVCELVADAQLEQVRFDRSCGAHRTVMPVTPPHCPPEAGPSCLTRTPTLCPTFSCLQQIASRLTRADDAALLRPSVLRRLGGMPEYAQAERIDGEALAGAQKVQSVTLAQMAAATMPTQMRVQV